MGRTLDEQLVEAIMAYDYPAVTYDFRNGCERRFPSMIDLDQFLQDLLWAGDVQKLKDGLSGILYWGYYRAGIRDYRVETFRTAVVENDLHRASAAIRDLEGVGLTRLQKIGLPQFSNMAFISKFRTFLDPSRYCVLDSKIAKLSPFATRLKRHQTYIPINAQNERVYRWWVDTCFSLAAPLQIRFRPVDVERGLFYLVDHSQIEVAERILSLPS